MRCFKVLLLVAMLASVCGSVSAEYPTREELRVQRNQLERLRRYIIYEFSLDKSKQTQETIQKTISTVAMLDFYILEAAYKEANRDTIAEIEQRKQAAELKHFGHRRNPGSEGPGDVDYQTLPNVHDLQESDVKPGAFYPTGSSVRGMILDMNNAAQAGVNWVYELFPPAVQQVLSNEVGMIKITDELNNNERGRYDSHSDNARRRGVILIRSINQPFDLKGKLVLCHELGHAFDHATDASSNSQFQQLIRKGNPVSLYALERPNEYFAEAFTMYFFAPRKLKAINPGVYGYMDQLLKGEAWLSKGY